MGCVDVSGVVGDDPLKATKVFIASNYAWTIFNFRAGLIRALIDSGCEVVALASPDGYATRLPELGCRFLPLPLDRSGTHPIRDLVLLWRMWRLLRHERPDLYLAFTVKPNIYGSLAAHALGIPLVNTITGLGASLNTRSWLMRLVRTLYRLALARSAKVFFQNENDRRLFVDGGLVQPEKTGHIPGSDVDFERFKPTPLPAHTDRLQFLLIARMLQDKGVGEFVERETRMT